MSKKKRSKILATLLCATTMAAFYASPKLVYAENLYYTNDGHTVTTDGGGNTAITGIEGLESVTFGVLGTGGDAGVRLYFDGNGNGGLKVDSSFTADYLYLDVADTYGDRYSLHNVLGIHRLQENGAYVTNIETGATGQGGMQVAQDSINIFGGKAIFSNANAGSISFNMAFDASEGMTVGTAYSVDTQGNIITSGTINSMTIRNNQVNGVTLYNNEVSANEVTAGDYELTDVGDRVEALEGKTTAITYDSNSRITSFSGSIEVDEIEVDTITSGNSTIDVRDAADTLALVNDGEKGLEATYNIATQNRTNIQTLNNTVSTFDERITGNTNNITALGQRVTTAEGEIDTLQTSVSEHDTAIGSLDTRVDTAESNITTLTGNVTDLSGRVTTAESEIDTLQKVTTGMSYDASSGTTFSQAVTANDFKIADGTSLSQVASELTTAQGDIQTNANNITTLTGRVTIAEGEIGTLQTATTGMNYNSGTDTTFKQVVNATDFKVGDVTLTGVAVDLDTAEGKITKNETAISGLGTRVTTAESEIDVLQTTVGDENSGLVAKTKNLNADGSTLTGMTNITTNTFTATSGSIGSIGFSGNNLTNVVSIGGVDNTVTVAGTAISNGSFNGVTISNYNSNGSTGAKINGISIYQDTDGHYNVGTIDLNDLTGSGSIGTVDGIVRTDNTPQDKEDNDYTTTIEGNLEVRTDGTITQRNGDFAVAADGTVTGKDFAVKGTGTTLSGVVSNVTALQTTVGNESSGLVKNVNDINTTVSGHTTSINALNTKTNNLSKDGMQLTGMDNIESAKGTIGGISFDGKAITDVTSIGADTDTINIAGTPISKGSFNGVSISNYNSSGSTGATINGISIYKDTNSDYIVGDVNISDLQGVSGTEIKGIKRTSNIGGGFTTTIEENLAVSTDGTIKQTNGDFAVDTDGNVTGKDFKVNGTSLGDVASAVNDQTKGLKATYDIASANQADITDEETGLGALNNKTTGMTYTAGTTTTDGITEFDHKLKATAFETENLTATEGNIGGISFETVNGVKTIGTDSDTITLAGNAISKGSFNGVNIGVDGSNHATFNGVSIYTDSANKNAVMVGGINISALQSTTGTKLEGIVREPNEQGGGYTTTIEGSLAVNSATGNVTVDGEVTADDFRVGDTTFTNVASNVTNLNTVTTGMTYTPAGNDTQAVTSFDHKVQATNITTTAGADLNELSATVGDESSGLVQNVNTLNNKTTNLSADGSTLTDMTNIESAAGTIGGMTFATVNGMKTIGSADDTITVAGAEITSNSFNNVEIYQKDENSHYFVGDVDVSALQSGSAEITNKLRGITYSNESGNDYTMTFAGVMSVSTEGEYKFKYNGNEYGLDDLINTVSSEDLAGFEELKKKVDKLEDKTTGIEFDEGTGSTTINDMDKDSSGNWVKGDNSLTVGDDGITANGDTVINGDTDDNTTGGNGNDSNDQQGGDSIINGDQLVNGDQHVTGDSQFDGTITVGSGTDGKGQTVIDGGNITTGDTIIDGGSVTSKEGHFDNINVGSGENATTIGESGIQVGDNTTIDNSGVSIKDENGSVVMGDHDVVIKDSDGNVEASLSDVANRVDGIEQSIGDLNSRMGELEDRIDKVGAMAAAIANLRTMGYDPAAPTEVAVGIGQYRNETGAALGLFHYPNRDFMLSLSVSTSGDEVMGGIGATWKFGRKSPEKVAAEKAEKAREAKLQKAEAIKEAARLKKIEAQQERHAKLAAQKTATK